MTDPDTPIRLLDLTYQTGARQLAVSEAIILAVGQGLAPPTLRLYSWSERVVIIGVGQPTADIDLEVCRERGYTVLRRIGGGTAVYHDADEVSVDLIVPSGHDLGPTDVHEGYRQFAAFLGAGLGELGVNADTVSVEAARSMTNDTFMRPICFASISPYEFFFDERKLDGLCQIRRRDAIAYQAAIYNRFRAEPLLASLVHESGELRERRRQRLDEFVTDIATARGAPIDYTDLQNTLARAISSTLGLQVSPGVLTEFEERETERLIAEKYANDEWTFRR